MKKTIVILGAIATIFLMVSCTTAKPILESDTVLEKLELNEKITSFLEEIQNEKSLALSGIRGILGLITGILSWIPIKICRLIMIISLLLRSINADPLDKGIYLAAIVGVISLTILPSWLRLCVSMSKDLGVLFLLAYIIGLAASMLGVAFSGSVDDLQDKLDVDALLK